ncbi:hypothetical protein GYH30_048054 [Glycine max]|nr:hypothetical protein GYH30_048054 [Glycine max]
MLDPTPIVTTHSKHNSNSRTSKWTEEEPVVAHEFEGGLDDAVEEGTAAGVDGGLGRLVLLEADNIDFEDGDNEVGEGADVVARAGGPLGVDVVGLEKDEVRAGVGEEPGGAIVDVGGALHHLVRRKTHGGRNSLSGEREERV